MGQPKAKLSVTVAADLVADIDRSVDGKRFRSRSAVVEAALARWLRQERDRDIDAYYDAQPAAERLEDLEWAHLGREALTGKAARRPTKQPARKRPARRPR